MSMLLGTNCTWPSTNDTITPPVWWPVAARLFPLTDQFGGWEPVTSPCDWWCTQKNWLHPLPSKHQLWLAQLDFSVKCIVLLVPSVTSAIRTALLIQPIPLYAGRASRSGQQVSLKFDRPES